MGKDTQKEEETGLNKQNVKKLFAWGGFKKELPWILFFLALLFGVWAYNLDVKTMNEITNNDCYRRCDFEIGVKVMQDANPGIGFDCDWEKNSCRLSGVLGAVPKFEGFGDINFSYIDE